MPRADAFGMVQLAVTVAAVWLVLALLVLPLVLGLTRAVRLADDDALAQA